MRRIPHRCGQRSCSNVSGESCWFIVTIVLLLIVVCPNYNTVSGYSLDTSTIKTISSISTTASTTRLFSSSSQPPQQRQPRRELQKRPRKNRKSSTSSSRTTTFYPQQQQQQQQSFVQDEFPWETAESRTIISYAARESGEDYWYDLEELQRTQEMEQQRLRNNKRYRNPNHISDSKLWVEVLSPYKQNWIGLISVTIIATAFIFKYFPEVIDPPIIANIPEMI